MEEFIAVICTIAGLFFGFILGSTISKSEYKQKGAMEVYRGNTKLEYTVVDSMVVDSCVIFLNK